MNQILPFPKEKVKRVQQLRKAEGQRLFLIVSLFSFVLVAVLANEQVMKNQRPTYLISDNSERGIEQVNRAIASAQPLNLFRDVQWEHELASRLSKKEERMPASLAQKVTAMDHLRYGALAGKYRITSVGSELEPATLRVKEIEYIDSAEINDRPVQISDHKGFLIENASLLPVNFKQTTLATSQDGLETWVLLSDEGRVVGEAALRFDEGGRFLKMSVQSLDRKAASE